MTSDENGKRWKCVKYEENGQKSTWKKQKFSTRFRINQRITDKSWKFANSGKI